MNSGCRLGRITKVRYDGAHVANEVQKVCARVVAVFLCLVPRERTGGAGVLLSAISHDLVSGAGYGK